jgi:C4-type Zn-finger protein
MKVELIQMGGKYPIAISEESHLLESNDNKEEFLESLGFRLDDGDLSSFNITNIEDFLEKTRKHLNRLV